MVDSAEVGYIYICDWLTSTGVTDQDFSDKTLGTNYCRFSKPGTIKSPVEQLGRTSIYSGGGGNIFKERKTSKTYNFEADFNEGSLSSNIAEMEYALTYIEAKKDTNNPDYLLYLPRTALPWRSKGKSGSWLNYARGWFKKLVPEYDPEEIPLKARLTFEQVNT